MTHEPMAKATMQDRCVRWWSAATTRESLDPPRGALASVDVTLRLGLALEHAHDVLVERREERMVGLVEEERPHGVKEDDPSPNGPRPPERFAQTHAELQDEADLALHG